MVNSQSKKESDLSESFNKILEDAVDVYGEEAVKTLLINSLSNLKNENSVLTIVVNAGIHPLPENLLRGDVFIASHGNLDFSSKLSIESEFRNILKNVSVKLQSNNWNLVYIVPFGPAVLSMLIKNLVYKVLYINSIDVIHAGSGVHFDIEIEPREMAIEANTTDYKI